MSDINATRTVKAKYRAAYMRPLQVEFLLTCPGLTYKPSPPRPDHVFGLDGGVEFLAREEVEGDRRVAQGAAF